MKADELKVHLNVILQEGSATVRQLSLKRKSLIDAYLRRLKDARSERIKSNIDDV